VSIGHLTAQSMHIFRPSLLASALLASLFAACGGSETVDESVPEPGCPRLVEDLSLEVPEPPDGAAACAAGDCNYQTQEGCSDDEACRPQFNATDPEVNPGCEPAGTGEAGDECSGQPDCARGFYCAGEVATQPGVCRKLCCGADWSACDEGESCIRSLSVKAGGEVLPAGVDLCFPVNDCDLFDPESCAGDPSRECKIVDPVGNIACAPKSNADLGDDCAPPTVCKQGLNCVGDKCVKLCAFEECGDPACTTDEGTSVHFARAPADVGECTLGR
jgi:hypothetical protein